MWKRRPTAPNATSATGNSPVEQKDSTDGEGAKEKESNKVAVTIDEQPPLPPVGFFDLFRYATKFEILLNTLAIGCAVASGAAQPVMTIIFGNLTNNFVGFSSVSTQSESAADEQALINQAIDFFENQAARNSTWLVVIGVATFVVTFIYMYIWTFTGEIISKRIRKEYLRAILRQDIAYFDQLGAGEVATRIENDTLLIQEGISSKVPLAASYFSAFVSGFIIAYIRNWRLALVVSCVVPCIVITVTLMQKFGVKYKELGLKSVAEGGSLAEEVISSVRTVQAFGIQATLAKVYEKHIEVGYKAELQSALVFGGFLGILFFISQAMYSLSFYWGTTLILQGHADSGAIVNVIFAILLGAFSLSMVGPELQSVISACAAAAKIFSTIDRVPPIDSYSTQGLRPVNVSGNLVFQDVSFHYPSRADVPVLQGLSLAFEAGKTSALVGSSGCGKSTIIQLIERFYDPVNGAVLLDGVNIKELNLRWLRQHVGFVQQEPVLFAATIRQNVGFGLIGTPYESAPEEQQLRLVKEACVKANADPFIQKLPLGYDTLVGERGLLLSGGQKQRIAIARAIVSDPKILLLDEATSALDTQSEGVVQDALDKAAAGRTTVIIAHRLSTIQDADCIYVVGNGGILEKGSHEQLVANTDGAYSQLVRAQKLRGDGRRVVKQPQLMSRKEVEVALAEELTAETKSLGEQPLRKTSEPVKEPEYGWIYLGVRMAKLNKEMRITFLLGCVSSIAFGVMYPVFGIIFANVLSMFAATDRHVIRHEGDRNSLWLFVVAIGYGFAGFVQNLCFSRAGANLVRKLRDLCFRSIVRQDIGYFDEDKHSTGALVSMLSENPSKVNGLVGTTLATILSNVATVGGGAIIGLAYAPKLAAVGIALIPFTISAGYVRLRVVILKDKANKDAHQVSAQKACEAAAAVRTVQSLTREEQCYMDYSQSLEDPLRRSKKTALWSSVLYSFAQGMMFFVIALGFWYGSRLIAAGEYSVNDFFVCLMGVIFGAIQAGHVFDHVSDMSAAKGATNDIVNLLDRVPIVDAESSEGEKTSRSRCHGKIQLEDVHFRYPTRPSVPVLRGVSLAVEPGTYVALVGESGCGKSTVIQLVERFYDPLAGSVTLDGHDISKLNVQDYRKHLAIVSQEPTLYAGTIRFNVLLGADKPESEVAQQELERACADANILEFIQSLPNGFDTQVGGKGSQLSGGQKQRIAIARALIRNPSVLLLDEATSALDSQSEKVVQTALDNAAKGRTTIAIAHRLSTIQNADRIFFIKDGRVAETGTHEELLKAKGLYYHLVQLQALTQI